MLRPRLGAARLALADKEGTARVHISKIQSYAVFELAAREPGLPCLSDEARAALVDLAVQGRWGAERFRARAGRAEEKRTQPRRPRPRDKGAALNTGHQRCCPG